MKPDGRSFLTAAPIGTETDIPCPRCGVKLAVAAGAERGERVLACQRLGCSYREPLEAATEMRMAGASELPGLSDPNRSEEDAVSTATASAAASGAATPAADAAGGAKRSARNNGKAGSKAERAARLMARAEDVTPATVRGGSGYGAVAEIVVTPTPNGPEAPRPKDLMDGLAEAMLDGRVADVQVRAADGINADTASAATSRSDPAAPDVRMLALDAIAPHALNPRKRFDEAKLQELADSIRQYGVQQPITVRSAGAVPPGVPAWWIVMGERRWRAARLAGLTHIPAIVTTVEDDADHLRRALLENLIRDDLDPIEEARGYAQLRDAYGMTQEAIGETIGRARASVGNQLRLLELPEEVQALISSGQLSTAHGKALLRFKPWPKLQVKLGQLAAVNGLASKALESGLPYPDELRQARLVVQLPGWTQDFDLNVCKACPFGATFTSGYYTYCLNPPHLAELKREAKATREAELARLKAAQSATTVTASGDDQAALGTGQGLEIAPAKLLTLADLRFSEHERVARDPGVAGQGQPAPSGCTTACPCAATVNCGRHPEGREGDCEGVTVCLDPQRFRELKAADERRAEDRRLTAIRRAHRLADDGLVAVTADDARALALVVTDLLRHSRYGDSDAVVAAVQRSLPAAAAKVGDPSSWPHNAPPIHAVQALAAAPASTLLRLAVEIAAVRFLGHHFARYGQGSDVVRWWLPAAAALRPGETGISAAEERRAAWVREILGEDNQVAAMRGELAYPLVSGLECDTCGGPVTVNSADELQQLADDLAEGEATGQAVKVFCDGCGAEDAQPARELAGAAVGGA